MRLLPIAALMLASGCASTGEVHARRDTDRLQGTFYNRPGATDRDLALELQRCRAIATVPQGSAVEQRPLSPVPDAANGGPVSITGVASSLEDCMVARGWRLFAMTAREAAEWNALSAGARDREMATLVGAPHPARGRLVRADERQLLRQPDPER